MKYHHGWTSTRGEPVLGRATWPRIVELFKAPAFAGDEEKSHTARVLTTLLNHLTALLAVATVLGLTLAYVQKVGSLVAILTCWAVLIGSRWLMLRGRVRVASGLLVTSMWLIFATLTLLTGGLSSINNVFFISATVIAGLLLGNRAALFVATLSALAVLGLVIADAAGVVLPQPFPARPVSRWVQLCIGLLVTIAPLNLAFKDLALALRRAREENRERRRSQEAMLRETSFSGALIDSLPGCFVMFDERGRIVRHNEALLQVTGYSAREMEQLDATALFDAATARAIDRQLAATEPATGLELECQLKRRDGDGGPWVLSIWRRLLGERLYLIVMGIEIAELKRVEREHRRLAEQLVHARKMESIGRLAGGIAHDFNNLLTGILGNTSLALMKVPADAACRPHLEEVEGAAQSAARLTRQLLAFSRKQIVEPQVLDLNERLDGMQRMVERLLGEAIELRTETAEDLWPVRIDPGQIEQVIVNLVINARDAMADGGRLTIGTANRRAAAVASSEPVELVALTVSDTGTGIPPQHRAHIFEPFFTTKPEGEGTGLGLATVYGIATQYGGDVQLQSEVGFGTTFEVLLPRAGREDDNELIHFDPSASGELRKADRGGAILLAEDEEVVRTIATSALQAAGYEVIACADGEAAIAAARAHTGSIQALVTDVVMPGLDGRALADALVVEIPHLKVLFTSGHTEDAIAQHGVLESGLHFLAKPYTPSALSLKLAELLSQAAPYRRRAESA